MEDSYHLKARKKIKTNQMIKNDLRVVQRPSVFDPADRDASPPDQMSTIYTLKTDSRPALLPSDSA